MLNQSRIALVTALLLCIMYVRSIVGQALTLVSSGATTSALTSMLVTSLVALPLPVMLAAWFRSEATITLSKRLRWCATGTAIVLGAFLVIGVSSTALGPEGWAISGAASASQPSLWHVLRYLSDAAIVLLLIALIRSPRGVAPQRNGGLLRNAALAASIAALVAVVLNTAVMIYTAKVMMAQQHGLLMTVGGHIEYVNKPTAAQIALSFALNSLPQLCRLMIPLIVYRSIVPVLRREGFSVSPGSPQQA